MDRNSVLIKEINLKKSGKYQFKYRNNSNDAQDPVDHDVTFHERPLDDFFDALKDLKRSITETYMDLAKMELDSLSLVNIKRDPDKGLCSFEFVAASGFGSGIYEIKLKEVNDVDWEYMRSLFDEAKAFILQEKRHQLGLDFGQSDSDDETVQQTRAIGVEQEGMDEDDYPEYLNSDEDEEEDF